ncbi:unnamed protein product [Brassica napus]|uniref:(rape) hypothetical protein n=1 Tax=Brassica napus TaxID=3708 RepID=A0A816Q4U1_BRANA|nr:unnamed protein product [Brassica napus]
METKDSSIIGQKGGTNLTGSALLGHSPGSGQQRSTSPGRALPGLDRTQYRFGVQKRQGSFRMGGGNRTRMVVATTGPSCHLDYLVRTETLHHLVPLI